MSKDPSRPSITELLKRSNEDVVDFLAGIYEHSPWVAQEFVNNVMPSTTTTTTIDTITSLAAALKSIVDCASKEVKLQLLCAHPDLCEKVGKLDHLTPESQEEQGRSGLQSLTEDELNEFTANNEAYKAKCGFPFILAVRNATKYTVLAALRGRVKNPAEVEFTTALEQVHKIAWMRLLSKIDTSDAKGFLTCHVLDTANGCPGKSFIVFIVFFLADIFLSQISEKLKT